jgi:cytochrome c biogenesis protein
LLKIIYKRTLKQLSSLPLAIGELLLVAGLSSVGTVIEQNKDPSYYAELYPTVGPKVRVQGFEFIQNLTKPQTAQCRSAK